MKRFFTIILLLLPTVASHTQDEPPFVATAKTSEGMIPMAYHVGYAYDDGMGVAVGYQEYNHPAIPIDFKGEIFLSDSIVTPDVCYISHLINKKKGSTCKYMCNDMII